jgi:glucokinase
VSEIVAVDIGGTHARFALADVVDGRVESLGEPCILRTCDYPGLEAAWAEFARRAGRPLPSAAAIAFAGSPREKAPRLTNGDWEIRLDGLKLSRHHLLNDFAAIAHAVANLDARHLRHLCGPARPLPDEGVVSIVGPGTGLGVAQLVRHGGHSLAVETEGGHIAFAPLDPFEDRLLAELRERFGRVSIERIVSGPGLAALYEGEMRYRDDEALWKAALSGEDRLAAQALDRFCRALGSVAGDIALAQGADAVVIAGGLGLRLADRLAASGFCERFLAKGRFRPRMEGIAVKILTHPEPGLYGAAAAFAGEFGG